MNDKLLIDGYNKWMNECVVERNGWMLKMENWMDTMTQKVVNNLSSSIITTQWTTLSIFIIYCKLNSKIPALVIV